MRRPRRAVRSRFGGRHRALADTFRHHADRIANRLPDGRRHDGRTSAAARRRVHARVQHRGGRAVQPVVRPRSRPERGGPGAPRPGHEHPRHRRGSPVLDRVPRRVGGPTRHRHRRPPPAPMPDGDRLGRPPSTPTPSGSWPDGTVTTSRPPPGCSACSARSSRRPSSTTVRRARGPGGHPAWCRPDRAPAPRAGGARLPGRLRSVLPSRRTGALPGDGGGTERDGGRPLRPLRGRRPLRLLRHVHGLRRPGHPSAARGDRATSPPSRRRTCRGRQRATRDSPCSPAGSTVASRPCPATTAPPTPSRSPTTSVTGRPPLP